jgi:hypothetical protein
MHLPDGACEDKAGERQVQPRVQKMPSCCGPERGKLFASGSLSVGNLVLLKPLTLQHKVLYVSFGEWYSYFTIQSTLAR